jgi:hypothetical protein
MALFKKTFVTEELVKKMKGEADVITIAEAYTRKRGAEGEIIVFDITISRLPALLHRHCGRRMYRVKVFYGYTKACGCKVRSSSQRIWVCKCGNCAEVDSNYYV